MIPLLKETAVAIIVLLLLLSLQCVGYATSLREPPRENTLWSYGVPRVVDWSNHGLVAGTSTGHLLVYDDQGDLKWERKTNYTGIWSVSWSGSGELVAVNLGPPGAVYVFASNGTLLWSTEFDYSQAFSAAWSGNLLAVGSNNLLVFDRNGKLIWSKDGTATYVSWYNESLAAVMCLGGPQCTWGIYVFDKQGNILWSFEGIFHRVSWSSTGDLAAIGGRAVYLFSREGKLKWWREESEATSLAWLGDLLAVGGRSGVTVFDKGGRVAWRYETEGYSVEALSPRGENLLGVGSQSGDFVVLDYSGRKLWSYWTCGYVWSIKWHGDRVAIASSDGYIHVLDGKGNLLWKKKVGFLVKSVAIHHGIVVAGGWDLNTVALDTAGNLRWSSDTGWVAHLAWHENILAVGGYNKLFVFDSDGNLRWSLDLGDKIRSLSWSDDGLLAVGLSDRFGVFAKNGTLLWGYLVPNWVISLSWSNRLLAVGVAGEGVYVFDRNGGFKWFFRSTTRNATLPWRVSASWWNGVLVVVTDQTYALSEDGSVLWSKGEIYGTVIAPGKSFVAFGGGRGVYVLDESGELEWSYTSPEVVSPRDYYAKLYPNNVLALSWVDDYLVAGDWLGRVFLFNETGDLIWVYSMGFAVHSIASEGNVIVIGGEGGLLVKELPVAPKPLEKMLFELPAPYNRFNRAYANKTLLHVSGVATIAPSQYIHLPGFTVSEGVAYAFFEAKLNSSAPVELVLMSERVFEDFVKTGFKGSGLTWAGEEIYVKVSLTPGTYYVALLSAEQAEVSYFIWAYESYLPTFEEKRVYLPMGVVDYGVASLPGGRIGYRYNYTEAWGLAEIRDLYATGFLDEDAEHWVSLQLNAFLHVQTGGTQQVYWVQNVAVIDTESKKIRLASNLWNVTAYPVSTLNEQLVKGCGSVAREARAGDYYFYVNESWVDYSYPVSVLLYLSVKPGNGVVKLEFGGSIAGKRIEIYDTVLLHVDHETAYFAVDPVTFPPSNIEFVVAGPSGARPKTAVERISASLRLFVSLGGEIIPVPTAHSYGYNTYERVKGVDVEFCGNYTACLTTGRAEPIQVYYSVETLPSMQILWIHDPMGVFGGVRFVEVGKDPDIPLGYFIDLGNMTRLVLKGYRYVSEGEITLNWGKQYYVSVYSDHGEVRGSGWYDEGGEARISISPLEIRGDLETYIFQGWEQDGTLVSTSPVYAFTVHAPTSLKARWITERPATTTTATPTPTTEIAPVAKRLTPVLALVLAFAAFVALAMILALRKKR